MDNKTIIKIEQFAANAWQPEEQEIYAGWRLGFSRGITRRGNSVLPLNSEGKTSIEEKVSYAETYYSNKGLPTVFQMTSAAKPNGLHSHLKTSGYIDRFHTQVQTASSEKALKLTALENSFETIHSPDLNAEWLTFYKENLGYSPLSLEVRENILRKISNKAAFVILKEDNSIASIGLGVLEENYMGIYCMLSSSSYLRQGCATQVLHSLAEWAINNSADQLYLQVMENNLPALALYKKSGFTKNHQYWYSEKPIKTAS